MPTLPLFAAARLGLAALLLAPALPPQRAAGQAGPARTAAPAPAGGTFALQGQLGSPRQGTAYLRYLDGSKIRVDSGAVRNGVFSFRGSIAKPTLGYVGAAPAGQHLPAEGRWPFTKEVYLEAGSIRLSSPDSLHHARTSGTPLNADNAALDALVRPLEARAEKLLAEYQAASPSQQENADFKARLQREATAIVAAKRPVVKQFILAHPGSLVSLVALNSLADDDEELDPAEAEPLFNALAPALRTSSIGQVYAGKLAKARFMAVGALAPDFTQNDANGKPVSLHDFRGKYVLVDFWASWCGPCRRENPNVVANYQKYKGRKFTVLGVSLDRASGRDAWLQAIATDKLTWTQVTDLQFWQNAAARLYKVESIPQNFLIGPDGRIVAKNLRGDELGEKLAAVLPK